jgi:hypothetical protein
MCCCTAVLLLLSYLRLLCVSSKSLGARCYIFKLLAPSHLATCDVIRVLPCCGFAVLPLNNFTAVLQHSITAALCLLGYLGLLGCLTSFFVRSKALGGSKEH